MGSETAPIEAGEERVVEIEDRGEQGDGVARVRGFVVLVPGADPGQRPLVRVEEVREDFARATVVASESDVEE